jgi:hypothetical protein
MRLRHQVMWWTVAGAGLGNIFPLTAPIHELGHVIAALMCGGKGEITGWTSCSIWPTNPFTLLAGGYGKIEIIFHANQIRSVRVTKHVDIQKVLTETKETVTS